jgi:hypothetical protein
VKKPTVPEAPCSEREQAEDALISAISSPQELLCLDETAARKVRFALYGLRYSLAPRYPGVMAVVLRVKGATVLLEPKGRKILKRSTMPKAVP